MSEKDPNTADNIKALCDSWQKSIETPDGGIVLSDKTEKFRLLENGVRFHRLDFSGMAQALTSLTCVVAQRNTSSVVCDDHHWAWSWAAHLLVGTRARIIPVQDHDLRELHFVCISAALARSPVNNGPDFNTKEEFFAGKEARAAKRAENFFQPFAELQLIGRSHFALSYLAFPLLEGTLKRLCKAYMTINGMVTVPFTVTKSDGTPRKYVVGKTCSSLRDLLVLFCDSVAHADLKTCLDSIFGRVESLNGGEKACDVIYKWRNSTLHGETSFQTIGGIVYGVALLISLFEARDDYTNKRDAAVSGLRFELQTHNRSGSSVYPPIWDENFTAEISALK